MENEKETTDRNELENLHESTPVKPHRQRIPYGEKVVPARRNYEPRMGYRERYGSYGNTSEDNGYRRPYDRNEAPYRPRYDEGRNTPVNDGQEPQNYRYRTRSNGGVPRGRYNGGGEQRPYGRSNVYNRQQGGFQRSGYYKRGGARNFGHNSNYKNGQGYSTQQHTADYDPNAKYNLQKVLRYKEENIDPSVPIRLNRFLSNAGVCSRREADQHIINGQITVNGEVVTELGHKVLRTDNVCFAGKPVSIEDKVYVLLNKPKDFVTTADDPEGRRTVMDLVKDACPERIYPVGRLDRNTTGVLLLTNDGEMAAKMMHPKFMKKKIYHVYCNKPVSFADMQKILEGVILEDGEIHADRIEYASEADRKQIGIEIHSGKNRIVRRIFENLGYRVVKLDRVYFAGLTKKNLRRGHWRFLEEAEVNMLRMGAYE